MSALRELLVTFTSSFDDKGIKHGEKSTGGLLEKLEHVGKAIAAAFVVHELVEFTHGLIEQGAELENTAKRVGLSTDSLQQWRYIAGQAHVSDEELTAGLRILQKNLYGAGTAGGEAANDLAKLKVHVKDSHGNIKDLDDLLPEIADGFVGLKSPIEKVALAQKLFGRGGAALVPLLEQGSAGVEKLREKFHELGGGLSEDAVKAAEEAEISLKDLGFASTGLKSRLAISLLPAVTAVIETLTHWVVAFQHVTADTHVFRNALILLGLSGAAAIAPLLLELLPIAAMIAIVILVVDDLIALFTGGKSAIGDFIDSMFGVGAAASFVETMRASWKGLNEDIGFVIDQLKWVLAHFDQFKDFFSIVGRDIKRKLGIGPEDPNAHGAEGFGSAAAPPPARGGQGFFSGLSALAGDTKNGGAVPNAQQNADGTTSAPDYLSRATGGVPDFLQHPAAYVTPSAPTVHEHNNTFNLTVPTAVDAKAPEVAAEIRKHVSNALDTQNRKAYAAAGGE